MPEAMIPIDTLDFHCDHRRLYIVDDGLVSGTMILRCQDCPRELSKQLGLATRRVGFIPEVKPMWCQGERKTAEHRKVRRSKRGVSHWACTACGTVRSEVTAT